MSVAGIVGGLAVGALVVSAALAYGGRRPDSRNRVAPALRFVAVAVTAGVAVALFVPAWRDSGSFAFALVGVPVASAGLVLGIGLAGRPTALAAWIAAAVMLAWSLVTSLGLGAYFLGPSVLMMVAAVASTPGRRAPKARRSGQAERQ